jgi:hypothetical protein
MQETVPNNCQTMWFSTITAVLNGDFNPPWTRLTPSQLNQNLGGWNPVGVWTQGFALARQVLYCLSHASCPFCSSYFEIGLCFLPRPGLQSYFRHPALLGRQVVCCHTQHFHCDGVLLISSTSRVAWNLDPPDLSLLLIKMGSGNLFCPGWPQIVLLVSSHPDFIFLSQFLTIELRLAYNSGILLPLPPECWDYRHMLPYLVHSG